MTSSLDALKKDFDDWWKGAQDHAQQDIETLKLHITAKLAGPTSVSGMIQSLKSKFQAHPLPSASSGKKKEAPVLKKELNQVIAYLKGKCSATAEAPGERYRYPTQGQFEGYSKENTLHVDSFLYSDDEVGRLQEAGTLTTAYCLQCGSKNTARLNYISHSLSVEDMDFIFSDKVLGNVSGKTILDIGSRLGAVLYYAALQTNVAKAIGVEINPYFVKLQNSALDHFDLKRKCQVMHADIVEVGKQVIDACDIIVMHNVFEWFSTKKQSRDYWHKIRGKITKPGTMLVSIPSIQQSMKDGEITDLDWESWVEEIPLDYPSDNEEDDQEDNEMMDFDNRVHLYKVK